MTPSIRFSRGHVTRYQRVLERSVGEESLAAFFELAWRVVNPSTPLEVGPHVDAMCHHIQGQLEDRDRALHDPTFTMRAQNLLINIPPRCLKTTVLVVATVWCWLRWPSMKILYLSTNPRVSINGARMARDLLHSPWFQQTFRPQWQVRDDQEALLSLGNTATGVRVSRGLGSQVVGEGADWICIDDPHGMTDSDNDIRSTIETYDAAVANRINNPRTSIRTAIMQRFREFDFSGHVLSPP